MPHIYGLRMSRVLLRLWKPLALHRSPLEQRWWWWQALYTSQALVVWMRLVLHRSLLELEWW